MPPTRLLPLALLLLTACHTAPSRPQTPSQSPSQTSAQPLTLTILSKPLHTGVRPFGINLSGQTYYDSGQLLRNLVFRNPGFEGETWQSILRCKSVTPTTCTDENQYTTWPRDFMLGAHFELLNSHAAGTILASSPAAPPLGITLMLPPGAHPKPGDFILLRISKPGTAEAGWWPALAGGATLATELHDLSPDTPGHQALRLNASGLQASSPGQTATISSFFDSLANHSFVQLHGPYRLQFRAKPLTPAASLDVKLERLDTTHGLASFFHQSIPLKAGWHDYTFTFPTHESARAVGTVGLSFSLRDASALLDDVSLTPAAPAPTAFRDEVVQTLRDLHPGVLRYMDNGTDFGSSLLNMLAPPFARERAGASTQSILQEDIPIGLHEFLVLCEAVGAEPWYSMPPGTSAAESAALIEYLAGPTSSPFGARRAALGHPAPWTSTFPTIHLELGNEQWNARSFAGATIADPSAYAHRAAEVFRAARTSPHFQPARFDLILGSWAAVPWWTEQELAASADAPLSSPDSIAFAPYLFADFNDASSSEAIFGPMFAQPEQLSSHSGGFMAQQAAALAKSSPHPPNLAVYETNLGTMSGRASQSAIDATVPSWGAGLAVADHMLLMLRDLGITTQALFCLPEFQNNFAGPNAHTMPLWGAVVDMGGQTNRRRPQFLALQAINAAILPSMLTTHFTGADPIWNQPKSPNDAIALPHAHFLQTFAFADGPRRSLILLNLSRTDPIPLHFAGPNTPVGPVLQTLLTALHLSDTNELTSQVHPVQTHLTLTPSTPYTLPPHSLTTLTWTQTN